MESGRHPWLASPGRRGRGGRGAARARDRGGGGRAAASDDGARMLRIAENVFVIEHDDATDEWPHGNTGVIVGRTGVFVIDSGYLPSRARADIALIRRVTDKPVRFLMTTHWHFDHNNGAIGLPRGFSGRHAACRAQHRALDRVEPGVLEGAVHGAGIGAARGARTARGRRGPWARARGARARDRETPCGARGTGRRSRSSCRRGCSTAG